MHQQDWWKIASSVINSAVAGFGMESPQEFEQLCLAARDQIGLTAEAAQIAERLEALSGCLARQFSLSAAVTRCAHRALSDCLLTTRDEATLRPLLETAKRVASDIALREALQREGAMWRAALIIIGSTGRTRDTEGAADGTLCENCEEVAASLHCAKCECAFCEGCAAAIHAGKAMKKHQLTAIAPPQPTAAPAESGAVAASSAALPCAQLLNLLATCEWEQPVPDTELAGLAGACVCAAEEVQSQLIDALSLCVAASPVRALPVILEDSAHASLLPAMLLHSNQAVALRGANSIAAAAGVPGIREQLLAGQTMELLADRLQPCNGDGHLSPLKYKTAHALLQLSPSLRFVDYFIGDGSRLEMALQEVANGPNEEVLRYGAAATVALTVLV